MPSNHTNVFIESLYSLDFILYLESKGASSLLLSLLIRHHLSNKLWSIIIESANHQFID